MRYSQTVRINLAHDRRKTNANDTYAAEDAIIQFGGDSNSMTWSEIKQAVDMTQAILENLSSNNGATDAGNDLSVMLNTHDHPINNYVINGAPTLKIINGSEQLDINGGKMTVTGEDSFISFEHSTNSSVLTDESLTFQDSSDSTITSISPGKISLKGDPIPILAPSFGTETINTFTCNTVTVDLDGPHESGPEFKFSVRILKDDGGSGIPISFAMNVNIGTWFTSSGTYEEVQLINGVDNPDSLSSSNGVTSNNVFYKRTSNTISVGWETGITPASDTFHYKVVQIC